MHRELLEKLIKERRLIVKSEESDKISKYVEDEEFSSGVY